MKYLEQINSPEDLKKLSPDELPVVAEEIRDYIETTVFKTGGHLASNLGVVDLTVALHYIFDFLVDKIVFDVSHQCYTHKILTGRRKAFQTLRQLNGISGFTNTKESPYDNFIVGHAGSSISTALGIASAKRLKNEPGRAIAVIGDASIQSGMAFEALNHAGHLNENLIVILNDNGMSIAKSTGSFSTYLTKVRLAPTYKEMKKDFISLIDKIPTMMRGTVKDNISRLIESVKRHIGDGLIFEELNFNYYGPIDGHDIPMLLKTLNTVKETEGPVLVHVHTEKGRGHLEAVNDPERYHGVSPLKKTTDTNNKISFTEAFSQSLVKAAHKDSSVVGITAAMPGGTGLDKFEKAFPDRYFDVGICEQHAIGLAGGLSTSGLKPVCAIYSTFLQRGYDQIFQEACLGNNHIVFIMDRAGIVGDDGATHAGVFDIAYLRTLPNMVLMSPKDSYELQEMLNFSLKLNCPAGIRFPRDNCYNPFDANKFQPIQIGKGEILREGDDVILIGYGLTSMACVQAADILKAKGIDSSVVNARFVKPLDRDLISHLLDCNKPIITVEDHSIVGGFGSAVLELACQLGKDNSQIHVMGIPDEFTEHGTRALVLKKLGLDPKGIAHFVQARVLQSEQISV